MIPHEIVEKMAAAMLPAWQDGAARQIARSPEGHIEVLLDAAADAVEVRDMVAAAQKAGDYCCQVGCGGGGCESCACCGAGYCVSGLDGVPFPGSPLNPDDDPDHAAEVYRFWLDAAAEHNPTAKALRDLYAALVELKPRDGRDELTVDRAPALDIGRLYPELHPVAYGRELSALVTGLYELVGRRALSADLLDITSIRFELFTSAALDGAPVFRARARLNPPHETRYAEPPPEIGDPT